ncbi:MAG: DNA primase [Chloroflexi bacterium]|nr:DNA primase [Chloroflexota bacterium]
MSVVDDVRQKIDIVDVISESVHLKKAGRNLQGLCPFHMEKTPSFIVTPDRQTWHCFGACGTGGDVFSFVMKKDNLEFGEALRLLARRAGVTLTSQTMESKAADERLGKLYAAAEAAAQFYQGQLLHTPGGSAARRYLEGRGLNEKTIEDFQLGFNPAAGGLFARLAENGHSRADVITAGLVNEVEGGGVRDRFPGRLIFPIRDVQGRVCGFGARAMDSSLPKYINTPQTEIFDKGGLSYGLDRAKVSIRRLNQAIIVEGYMDVLMAHQHNYAQVVASMGTSLTDKQVGHLKKYSKNIILALDADAAGAEATMRAHDAVTRAREEKVVPLVLPRGIVRYETVLDAEVRVLVPSGGRDPDEVIRDDSSEWQRLIDNARPLVEFVMDAVSARHDVSQASGKSQAAQEMLPFLAEIKDPVRQAHYLQRLARLLGIEEPVLAQSLKKAAAGSVRPAISLPRSRNADEQESPLVISRESGTELYCLALLLQCPELRDLAVSMSPDCFESSQCREIFRVWRVIGDGSEDILAELDPLLHRQVESLRAWPLPPAAGDRRQLELGRVINRLREIAIRRAWRAKEAATPGLEHLKQNLEPAEEMQKIFKQRQRKVGLGE